MECMVCGKLFPRGPLDMARHTSAITLKHLFQDKKTSTFCFGCSKCGLHFTMEEHLKMHKSETSCAKGKKSKGASGRKVTEEIVLDGEDDEENTKGLSLAAPGNNSNAAAGDGAEVETPRTLECMICGKLFPRGPVDLARHTTAVTLRHLSHRKRSHSFPHGCSKCDTWFTTEDHLMSHKSQSSCNPDMVWPHDANEKAGLRCVLRGTEGKSERHNASKNSSSSSSSFDKGNKHSAGAISKSKKSSIDGGSVMNASSSSSPRLSRKRNAATAAGLQGQRPSKVGKILVPEDRKALFALVSLLLMNPEVIDKSDVAAAVAARKTENETENFEVAPYYHNGVQITDDNYLSLLPAKHKSLIEKLQGVLLYNC